MSNWKPGAQLAGYLKRKALRKLVARIGMAKLFLVIAAALVGFLVFLVLLAMLAGGTAVTQAQGGTRCTMSGDGRDSPPARLVPIYAAASQAHHLGPRGPGILAAINQVETGFGTNLNVSSAGAQGWMQFMPETWAAYGVDANHDGVKDPYNPRDAIFAAARYLRASGAPGDWYEAIFAYNHADWYVEEVEGLASGFSGRMVCSSVEGTVAGEAALRSVRTLHEPRAFRALPARLWVGGSSPQAIDSRIWPNAVWLLDTYHLRVTAAREAGHETHGDGTALDIVPAAGQGWERTAQAAAEALGWREPCGGSGSAPTCPLVPAIQFVGYNGYSGHGDPAHGGSNAHLHVSWQSSSFGCSSLCPPPEWIRIFPLTAG